MSIASIAGNVMIIKKVQIFNVRGLRPIGGLGDDHISIGPQHKIVMPGYLKVCPTVKCKLRKEVK